jgi:hypothetical protein
VFEQAVEVAGEVAFEAAGRIVAGLPFSDSPVDVVDRRLVRASPGDDDLVECAVELAVA